MLAGGFSFQRSLIFYPGKLPKEYRFEISGSQEEIFIRTKDGEDINALFYPGSKRDVIVYFHGNAGDLSNWQFIAKDFTKLGYNFLIIDYRGYGKSSGVITEKGLYEDAEAAYQYLVNEKGFSPKNIIIYGRSIGSGVAVELAKKHETKGLILESAYSSLKKLANEKMPYLFPSLILRYHFDSIEKINDVKSPVIFFHGSDDTLIPLSHTNRLYEKFTGKKKKIIIQGAGHNDLNSFTEYHQALASVVGDLFE
jgi:hypothetical protein